MAVTALQVSKNLTIKRVVIFYALVLTAIPLISGFNGLYGQDSYAYLSYSKHVQLFLHEGVFPPSFFWPVAYPLIGALIGFLCNNLIGALLCVSIACSVISFFFLYKSAKLLYPDKINQSLLFLVLFYCLSPFVVRVSVSIMSDMPAIACTSASFYYSLLSLQKKAASSFLLFVFFASLAIITRYVSFVILCVPAFFCTIELLKRKQVLYLFYGAALAFIAVLPHLYFKQDNLVSSINHEWLRTWSFGNFFKNTFQTIDGFQSYSLINALHVFSNLLHPGFIFTGIVCVLLVKPYHLKSTEQKLLLISLLVYALFLGGMPIQNYRFLLLSFPLVLLLYLPPAFYLFSTSFFRKNTKVILFLIVSIQITLSFRAILPFYKLNKLEKTIATSLSSYSDYKTLYTSGMEGPLSAYGAKQVRKSLYLTLYTRFEKPALILINPKELDKQWQGKNPELNWRHIKIAYHPRLLTNYGHGWELYEIN